VQHRQLHNAPSNAPGLQCSLPTALGQLRPAPTHPPLSPHQHNDGQSQRLWRWLSPVCPRTKAGLGADAAPGPRAPWAQGGQGVKKGTHGLEVCGGMGGSSCLVLSRA
jgi:hypothetical protein